MANLQQPMNLQQAVQQLMKQGNTYGQPRQKQDKSTLEQTIAQMLAAQKMDANTMAGFALGKLLRDGFNTWKDNYDQRGALNNALADATPEKRTEMLQDLQQKNPKQYERSLKALAKRGIDVGGIPQSGGGEINSDVTAQLAQQALGSNLAQNALTQGAVNFDSLPEVDSPFGNVVNEAAQSAMPWNDDDNWNKWAKSLANLFGR